MFKNFFLMTFLTFFLIAALAGGAAVEGMPWRDQLSIFANQALYYMHETARPAIEFIQDLTN